jgi:hypothetical protein
MLGCDKDLALAAESLHCARIEPSPLDDLDGHHLT